MTSKRTYNYMVLWVAMNTQADTPEVAELQVVKMISDIFSKSVDEVAQDVEKWQSFSKLTSARQRKAFQEFSKSVVIRESRSPGCLTCGGYGYIEEGGDSVDYGSTQVHLPTETLDCPDCIGSGVCFIEVLHLLVTGSTGK